MRGCLAFLVFVAALLAVLAYGFTQFALPALVTAGVRSSPLIHGQDVAIKVETSLDGVLLHGRVDRIDISGDDLTEPNARIGRLELTLRDVTLLDHTFGSAEGVLTGLELQVGDGSTATIGVVLLTGSSTSLEARVLVASGAAESAIQSRLRSAGVPVEAVRLGLGRVDLTVVGQSVATQLRVTPTGLDLDAGPTLGLVEVVSTPPGGEWRIASVGVTPLGIELVLAVSVR